MLEIIPNWHPILVHFTVALLAVAVILHLLAHLSLPRNLQAEWRIVARWSLWIGAGLSLVTGFTGWLAYNSVDHDELSHLAMTDHRNWAIVTLVLFVVLALWSWWNRLAKREPTKFVSAVYSMTLVVAGVLLASTAWRGGELVYRHGLGVMSLPNRSVAGSGREPVPLPAEHPGAVPERAAATTAPAHDHSTHKH
ncbi:MAG: DUF2231 domain-containing protein [Gammaproteobacteria bacterium]|nr:DUF2231 domain-containing protein [Gammaproteobacteria bacterium]